MRRRRWRRRQRSRNADDEEVLSSRVCQSANSLEAMCIQYPIEIDVNERHGLFLFPPLRRRGGKFHCTTAAGRTDVSVSFRKSAVSRRVAPLVNIFSVHVNHDSDITIKRTFIIAGIDANLGHLSFIICTEKEYSSSYSSTQHPQFEDVSYCKLGGTTNIIIQFNHVNEAPTT